MGGNYQNACSAQFEHAFLLHYEQGCRIYHIQQRVEALHNDAQRPIAS